MTAALPWSPPRLPGTLDTLALWNALVSHLGQPLPLRGQAAAVVERAAAPGPQAVGSRLRFAAGPEIVLVPLAFPYEAVFGAVLDVADLNLLPDALRDALCEGLAATFLAALPEHGLGPAETLATGPWPALPAADAALLWFRATVSGPGGDPAVLQIGAGLDDLAGIFGGRLAARLVWPGLKHLLTRDLAVTLARLTLPLDALDRLVPGAVVVLAAGVEQAARLRLDGEVFEFHPGPQGWTCAAVTRTDEWSPTPPRGAGDHRDDTPRRDAMTESTMDPALPAQIAAEPPRDGLARRLTVAVDLDLGRLTVPLAELETWQAGSVLALDIPVPSEGVEVALRANGRPIGVGELVRIDDRLAVRIARMSPGG